MTSNKSRKDESKDKQKDSTGDMGASHQPDVSGANEVLIDSAEKWQPASTVVTQYRIPRPDGTTDVFQIQGIPSAKYYAIMQETKPMEMPTEEVPVLDKRNRPVDGMPKQKIMLENDPAYLANVQEMNDKRMTKVVDAALTFDIPGETWQEKHVWLQARLPGDVINLYNTIERLLFNLSEKYGEFL